MILSSWVLQFYLIVLLEAATSAFRLLRSERNFNHRLQPMLRLYEQSGRVSDTSTIDSGKAAQGINGTTPYLEQLSFERSSATYEDLKLPEMETVTTNKSSLHSMIQVLRKSTEFRAVHLAEILANFARAILPEGVSRQDEVKTHWIPGNPVDNVLPYCVDELKDLSRGDLCTLVVALGSCRCPINDVVHIVRALRLARRMSSKLLYVGVKNAISRKNPLVAYAMLKESTQLSAVSFLSSNSPERGASATGGGEATDGYSEVSDDMGMYKGYLKNGVKDGYGTYVFNNGEIFEGFFADGEMHEGRFRSNCGSVYEGQILNGKMHGKGIFKFSNGDVYEGDFYHSQRHGWGVFLSTTEGNAERYEGQFYQNMKHGKGTVYMSFPHRHVYHGDFFQNVMHGNGTVYFENGDLYVGQLENNCPHGFGTYYCNLPPAHTPPGVDFAALVRNSSSLLGRGDLAGVRDPDDLDEDEDEDEDATGSDQGAEGGIIGAKQDSDNGGGDARTSRGLRGDLLLDALREWEELVGRLDDRPAQRETLRANRTFLGAGNSYIYVGEWRENRREGLGRLETMFYSSEGTTFKEPQTITVYEGEWRANREHGVGLLVSHDAGRGDSKAQHPRVRSGVWKAGQFEREHKGFKRPEPLSASPSGSTASVEKAASDLEASLSGQQHVQGFDGIEARARAKERAPDEFVKQHLRQDGDRSSSDDAANNEGGQTPYTEVSMSTITDRAALMNALESQPSSCAPERNGEAMQDASRSVPGVGPDQRRSPRNEMLCSREGVIYIPRPAASQVKPDGNSERKPIDEPGRLNAQAKNSSQEEEDQERLWIEGYGELEPPGKDLEGDMEIRYSPLVDITTIDELLDELAYVGEVDTAVELTESLAIRKLGEGVVPTLSTYSTVAVSAGRLGRPDVMLRVLRYAVLEQSRRGLVLYSETLFLTALNICAICGDYHNALRVFNLYEGRYGVVQQKAYSLVLVSYISASHHDAAGADSHKIGSVGDSRRKEKVLARSQYRRSSSDVAGASATGDSNPARLRAPPKLVTLVNFLVNSNLDSSNHALASLILNFKAMQGDVGDASAYFLRLSSPRRSQCPSSAALIAYADLLRTKCEWTLARELILYMDGQGLIPYPRLKRYVENNNVGDAPLWSPPTGVSSGGRNLSSEAAESSSGPTKQRDVILKGSEEVEPVLTVTEPPPVNVSGLPLSRTQLRRYHHYYVSPVLGQFQDPLVVEAVARKTKQKARESSDVPDSVWHAALVSQAGSGSGGAAAQARGDGGRLLRPPSPTDLYLLSSHSNTTSGVHAYLARDTGELEALLNFLLDLVALQVTPGPVPASIDLDLTNPLIYEDVVGIVQTLAWAADYQCCFANPAVWGKLVELTSSMAPVGFEEGQPGKEQSAAANLSEAALLYPRLSSRLMPSYFRARQRYLARQGQEDATGAEEDDDGELELSEEVDEGEEQGKDEFMPTSTGSALNDPIDVHTKLLLRRRNTYMGLMTAALAHGNKHRLTMHQVDRKWVRLLHQIGEAGKGQGTRAVEQPVSGPAKQYQNYLLLGATVNTVNGGDIGKNNPQRGRLLDAQAALRQVQQKSLPVIDAVLAVLELMKAEQDGILLAMLDPCFCQDMLSLLCRAGNAYGPVAGIQFKPMRATELRVEQFPKLQRVFSIIAEAATRHRESRMVPRGHGEDLIRQMLTQLLSPCRFGAQPGCDSVLDLPSFLISLEGHYGLRRLDFPSQVHERVLEGLFRAGEPQLAKEYFDSIEPSRAGTGPPRAPISAKVYETHISRLLRDKDTAAALGVLQLLERGPAAASLPPGAGPGVESGEHPDDLMKSLLQREEGDSPAADDTDPLQVIIDQQLEEGQGPPSEQPDTRTVNKPHGASQRFDAASPAPNPELRLMLTSLYSKVLNVYRATNRTAEARRLISLIRGKQLALDVSQAHSLMDIEIKARNFAGALELYDLFFPPAMDIRGSLLNHGGTGPVGHYADGGAGRTPIAGGGVTRECPELKAVVAMARALTRIVYPDSDLPGPENPAASTPSQSGGGVVSKRLAESAMGYILNVIHHFPELTRQTRALSGVYGVVGRLARLATEAGNLEATLALYTFIPLRDRRLSPWSIIAKQMADCSSFSPGQTTSGRAELQDMQGRAELSLLLMRAEGQRGDFSGGMSPLSLINAVTAAQDDPVSTGTGPDDGHKSILYDPYLQFTPPVDECPPSDAGGADSSGVVNIPAEVIGHAVKALLLPHPSPRDYSPLLRAATSRRALALAPALFSTMRSEGQYPTWPLTFLFFAAGGLPAGDALEARSLHFQAYTAYRASLGADLDEAVEEEGVDSWVSKSMACLSELDANLLVAAVLSTESEEGDGKAYVTALTAAMRQAGFQAHSKVLDALRARGLTALCTGLESTQMAKVRQPVPQPGSSGGLVLVGGSLFVGLMGEGKVTHEEAKHGKPRRTMVSLYGERIAADVLVKFQRGTSEVEALGQIMLELLCSAPVPASALDAAQCDREEASDSKGWALARLHAVEREVARLMETDFEPEVLYPGLALPAEQSDNMPIIATSAVRQKDPAGGATARTAMQGANLGNLARNLQGQNRRRVLRTARRKDRGWQAPRGDN